MIGGRGRLPRGSISAQSGELCLTACRLHGDGMLMGSWGAPGHMALTGVSRWSIWSEVTNDTWVGNVSSAGMLHAAQSTVIARIASSLPVLACDELLLVHTDVLEGDA